ncbi:hypothetical protein [Bremerella cremea]|uniref:hypothetical protein n=1 Tax=Bremerella cremea TaxID=1031537 RepID=UPI0031E9C08C
MSRESQDVTRSLEVAPHAEQTIPIAPPVEPTSTQPQLCSTVALLLAIAWLPIFYIATPLLFPDLRARWIVVASGIVMATIAAARVGWLSIGVRLTFGCLLLLAAIPAPYLLNEYFDVPYFFPKYLAWTKLEMVYKVFVALVAAWIIEQARQLWHRDPIRGWRFTNVDLVWLVVGIACAIWASYLIGLLIHEGMKSFWRPLVVGRKLVPTFMLEATAIGVQLGLASMMLNPRGKPLRTLLWSAGLLVPTFALTLYQTGYYVERKEPYYQFIALPDGQHWFLVQIGTQAAWWLAAVLTLASLGTIIRCCSRKPKNVT